MLDHLRQLVYSDKIFDNPVLGKVSCGAFTETLTNCKQVNYRSGRDNCIELQHLTSKCYNAKNIEQVNGWIMTEFQDSLMLLKFLEERRSTLPEKMGRNSWAVFTNRGNLDKYEQLTKGRVRVDMGNVL